MFTHFTEHQAKMDRRHMVYFRGIRLFLGSFVFVAIKCHCSFSSGHGISTGLPAVGCSF